MTISYSKRPIRVGTLLSSTWYKYLPRSELKDVFFEDVSTCPKCSGPMRWLEVATSPEASPR